MSFNHTFLFASLDSKQPLTTRKVHIRRLYDILQLSIQRHDVQRAKRAWSILARCKEINWLTMWRTGLHILGEDTIRDDVPVTVDYLRSMMLQYPDDRETILKELVFRLILARKCREALDELELYLPSFPYQDNPTLHIYAGLTSLYLAQPTSASGRTSDSSLMRDAQTHFDHAKALDPNNDLTQAFLDKISVLRNGPRDHQEESDDDSMFLEDTPGPRDRKRARTGNNDDSNRQSVASSSESESMSMRGISSSSSCSSSLGNKTGLDTLADG